MPVAAVNKIVMTKKLLTNRDKRLLEELERFVFFGSLLAIVCLVGLFFLAPSGQDKIWELSRAVITNLIPVPFLFVLSYLTYRRVQSITTEVDNESLSELISQAVVNKLNDPKLKISQISEIQEILSSLDVNAIALSITNERYGGVESVRDSLYVKDLEKDFSESKTILIMNTWIPNLEALSRSLITAINKKSETRIMMLYPNSGVATLRSEALSSLGDNNNTEDRVKMGVENCLEIFNEISNKINPENRNYLKIKLFNSLPSISVYATDEHYFVSFFMHQQLAINAPQLKVSHQNSLFGRSVKREIDTLWEIGKEVRNLKNWRSDLDWMAREFNI